MKLDPLFDLLHLFATPFLPALLCIITSECMRWRRGRQMSNAVLGFSAGLAFWGLHVWTISKVLYHGEAFHIVVLAMVAALPVLGLAAALVVARQINRG